MHLEKSLKVSFTFLKQHTGFYLLVTEGCKFCIASYQLLFLVHVFERFVYSIKSIQMFDVLFGFSHFFACIPERLLWALDALFPIQPHGAGEKMRSVHACVRWPRSLFFLCRNNAKKCSYGLIKNAPAVPSTYNRPDLEHARAFQLNYAGRILYLKKSEQKYLRSCEMEKRRVAQLRAEEPPSVGKWNINQQLHDKSRLINR